MVFLVLEAFILKIKSPPGVVFWDFSHTGGHLSRGKIRIKLVVIFTVKKEESYSWWGEIFPKNIQT